MNLVVVPFHDWKKCEHEGFRTRDAHFMEEFGRHPHVDKMLVINRPTSLAETLLLRRSWKVARGTPIFSTRTSCISQVGEKIYTCDIHLSDLIQPLWLKRKWVPLAYGQQIVAETVQSALELLGMYEDYSLFMSAPLYVPLVKQLAPKTLVLDAQDNLLKHSLYRDTPQLAAYYQYCRDFAEVIFANSLESARWLGENRSQVYYIANGVDTLTMDANRAYPIPADMVPLKEKPVVGYAGKMQEMVDVQLVEKLVASLPEVNFVFIGQILRPQWVKQLWQYPNVYHLGDKNYSDLPAYLAAFDICTIPYSVQRQHGGDPIKFYEYLAMGKPVVTTNIGGVSDFSDYPQVAIAQTHDEFLDGVATYLSKLAQGETIEKRPIPSQHTWAYKVDTILEKIQQARSEKNSAEARISY